MTTNIHSPLQEQAPYVLVTAAFNEEMHIERLIRSVIVQTKLPSRWVIVSDGSTDHTDEIVRRYSARYPFLVLHRIVEEHPRNFQAQVLAINAGFSLMQDRHYGFVGNLDADVTLPPEYFETILVRFAKDQLLGLAGGCIVEPYGHGFRARAANREHSVAHAVQLFRRECFEVVAPYVPMRYGGPDWVAELRARQYGWKVRTFNDLPVRHYRPTTGAEGLWRGRLRQGRMDRAMGSRFLFELLKCARRMAEPPTIVGALLRLFGYCELWARREAPLIPDDLLLCLREEQRRRLWGLLGGGVRCRPDRRIS